MARWQGWQGSDRDGKEVMGMARMMRIGRGNGNGEQVTGTTRKVLMEMAWR